mgnify:FL=1
MMPWIWLVGLLAVGADEPDSGIGGVVGNSLHDPSAPKSAVGEGRARAKLIQHGNMDLDGAMASLHEVLGRIDRCLEGVDDGNRLRFEVHFSPEGLQSATLIHSTAPGSPIEACVVEAVHTLQVPTRDADLKLFVYFTLLRDPAAPPVDHYDHNPTGHQMLGKGRVRGKLRIQGPHELYEGERSLHRTLRRMARCVKGEVPGDFLRYRLTFPPDGPLELSVDRSTVWQMPEREACLEAAVRKLRLRRGDDPRVVLVDIAVLREKPETGR